MKEACACWSIMNNELINSRPATCEVPHCLTHLVQGSHNVVFACRAVGLVHHHTHDLIGRADACETYEISAFDGRFSACC